MTTPRVSVVMPVRNGQAYLAEAVESILAQTLSDLELIVVDDGSVDATAEIVASFAERDGRVRELSAGSRGLVPSLNAGCAAARADLVARMDADDVAVPGRLERQLRELDARPRAAAVGSAMIVTDEAGMPLGRWSYPLSPDEIRRALSDGNPLAHPTVMFRRAAVRAVGGYREAFLHAEDYDLWLRLATQHELANVGDALVRYRLHGEQVTASNLEQQVVSTLAARALARRREGGAAEPALPARVDRSFLGMLDLGPADVDRELVRAAATWADLLVAAKRVGAASAVLDAARAETRTRHGRAALDRRRATVALRSRRLRTAAGAAAVAVARDPRAFARAAARRMRRGDGAG